MHGWPITMRAGITGLLPIERPWNSLLLQVCSKGDKKPETLN
jgi:hypothetical protein